MKAVNDYRILMPNIPYYETGVNYNQFDVVYYTGIPAGSYIDPGGTPTETISTGPFATGYYYAKGNLSSGINYFYMRPDSIVSGPSGPNVWTQDYFFVPCYGSSINFKANYFENKFQDNYYVVLGKSANVLFAEAKLVFKGVSDNEAKALNHFYQNSFVKDSLPDGQGHKTIDLYIFPPHTKKRPYYLKSIENDFENVNLNNVTLNLEMPFISVTDWREKLIPYTNKQNYNVNTTYSKHDYILIRDTNGNNGFYYFSGDQPSNSNPITDPNSWTRKFYFEPDLVQQIGFESEVFKNELGNFYLYQDTSINPNSFDFNLTFSNRSDKEAQALLHFLEFYNGIDLFQYDMYTFFTGTRSFYCPEWSHTYNFIDNNTITAKFVESKFTYQKTIDFNTILNPTGFDFGFLPAGFSKTHNYYLINKNRKYPVSYGIGNKQEGQNNSSSFFNIGEEAGRSISVAAGGSGYFDVNFAIPQTVSNSADTNITGYFQIFQESENIGVFGPFLTGLFTGQRVNVGSAAPYNFLSGVQNCVASKVYDFDTSSIGLKVRWTIPTSGFYFTKFIGKLATNSSLTSATEKTLSVDLNSSTNLYDIGQPGKTTYELIFNNLSFDTPYYVGISGQNDDYSNGSGTLVYASGVSDVDAWPNPTVLYPAVQSGLTQQILTQIGASAPSITLTKDFYKLTTTNRKFDYLIIDDYIKQVGPAKNNYSLFSGIVLNFSNCSIGPSRADINHPFYENYGSLLINGNYSAMSSGLTLNFIDGTTVLGQGGSINKTNNSSAKQGKNAIYIDCVGVLNINLDKNSIIAGGGGAGENIDFIDVVEIKDSKYGQLKTEYNNIEYNNSGLKDLRNNVKYNAKKTTDFFRAFNSPPIVPNDNFSTLGSVILNDFFDVVNSASPVVYGSPGASYGVGTGVNFQNNSIFVSDANQLSPSSPYSLYMLNNMQADLFPPNIGRP